MTDAKKALLEITVNGRFYSSYIDEDTTLLDYLRRELALTGTKCACNSAECGACTVIVDGRVVYSCSMLAIQAFGKSVLTIEGASADRVGQVIQQAYIDAGAVHCGFCTPGFIMSTKALLERNHHPAESEIREALAGNLCRCTGYVQIVDAVMLAAERLYGSEG